MKHYTILRFICGLLIYSWLPCNSVSASNAVKYISNINGLSNNAVNCMYEDAENNMWFGTWDGLNVYNSRDIRTFRYNRSDSSSISNNIIRQVLEQDKRFIWVSTDYGINRLDKETLRFTRYYLGTENKTPKQERSFIIGKTPDNRIICFVRGEGFFHFDHSSGAFLPVPCNFTDYVKDFIIDPDNRLFILFQDNDIRYHDLSKGAGTLELKETLQLGASLQAEKIFYSNGYLITNLGQTVSLFDASLNLTQQIILDIPKNISQAICIQDRLYVSFHEGGCIGYSLKKNTFAWINEIPERTSIFSLYYGSQQILWAGSDGHGVLQLYEHNSPFETVLTDHPVRSFCEEKPGSILVGTKGGGIKLLDKRSERISDYLTTANGLISNSVYNITKNKSGDIFIGTEGEGINVLRKGTHTPEKLHISAGIPYFKAVYSIHFTNNDSLMWVGTSGYGLFRMSIGKEGNKYIITEAEQFISSDRVKSLNNDVVYTIVSNGNKLWFGTRGGGLYQIDINRNTTKRIEDTENDILLTNNDVLCLSVDDNTLWTGTSYGLNKLDLLNNMQLQQYTENEGLNNNTIHGVLINGDHSVWVSTSQGLASINNRNEIESFTFKDGLQNDEFSDGGYYKDSEGYFYFGGVSGFNYFHPRNIQFREYDAPIELSALRIYNTAQNIRERIYKQVLKLSYDERYATFTFISKDFINNENCEYAYRLLDYSDEWIYLGNNPNIVFSKLPPGSYQLEVKNTNGDKRWSNHVYKLKIQVGYPWWLSTPAIIVYILVLIVIIYITQSVIRNRIRLSRQILIEQIEMQQQQKTYESKLNFFTNVAHEFFTPLTLIFGGAQHLLEKEEMNINTKKYLQIIKNNAERMQRLISELMEFRKAKSGFTPLHPEHVNIMLLTEYVSDNYMEVLQENKIDFRINTHDISTLYTDRDSLEKIFFNLFSNAFKYTPRSGYIHVEIGQDIATGNVLHFSIRNSGKGLTDQQMNEIFDKFKIFDRMPNVKNAVSTGVGLGLTKSLVELLGGKIEVKSLAGEYVEFSFVIPQLPKQHTPVTENEGHPPSVPLVPVGYTEKKEHVNILIVDDEKNIRGLLKDILEPLYTILEASDGKEALEIINLNHPDIIITDIMMPNMDGIGLIDILKSNPKTGYIPVISLSAKTSVEDHVDAYTHGVDMYIAKPFHPKHIMSAIESLLSKQTLLKEYFNSNISSYKLKNGSEIHQEDEQLIQEIIDYIRKNIDDESLNPNTIAEFMNISKAGLYRKLKELTDKTPSEFVRSIRLEHASKLLVKTKLTVSEIMYRSGFTNKSYFYREFQKVYGCSPKDYRTGKE